MKLVAVEVHLVDEPAVTPAYNWRRGLPGSEAARVGAWLVLTTDEGHQGFGYCRRGPIFADVVERRFRQLVGRFGIY